jgi:Nucleotidyltransferase domain
MGARFRARRHAVDEVVARAGLWAHAQPDVLAVVVVGSYAYERPRMSSDVDLVMVSTRVSEHLSGLAFIQTITPTGRVIRRREWGPVHERRVRLGSGLHVEFGLTTPDWVALPLDAGAATVLSHGCKIVTDDGRITRALESICRPAVAWRPVAKETPHERA